MKESLTNRVGRLVSAGLNAALDAVENVNPEMVLQQTIREIDGTIDDVRAELGKVMAQKHLASKRLMEENSRHEQLAEKIELAVTQSRDDLAEAGIAQQMDIEARIPVLETTITESTHREHELNGFLNALQSKKRDMEAELRAFRQQREQAALGASQVGAPGSGIDRKIEQATGTFDRVMERATGVPSHQRAADMKSVAQVAELEDLARRNRVQERLAALKAKKPNA